MYSEAGGGLRPFDLGSGWRAVWVAADGAMRKPLTYYAWQRGAGIYVLGTALGQPWFGPQYRQTPHIGKWGIESSSCAAVLLVQY